MIKLRVLKLVLSSFCWYSTIFQLKFVHKRWQWLYSIRLNWGEGNPRLCHQSIQIIHYSNSLCRCKSILIGTTIPLYIIICCRQSAHAHQNCTNCGFPGNLSGFNSLNQNLHIVACCQWGDSQVWEQITLANRARKLLTGPLQKCKCFLKISQYPTNCLVEL